MEFSRLRIEGEEGQSILIICSYPRRLKGLVDRCIAQGALALVGEPLTASFAQAIKQKISVKDRELRTHLSVVIQPTLKSRWNYTIDVEIEHLTTG